MNPDSHFKNKHIVLRLGLFIGIFFMILVICMLLAAPKAEAVTIANVQDAAPSWINENSARKVVLNLTLHNNTGGIYNNLTWINLIIYNDNNFNLASDLRALTTGSNSGIIIYNESNNDPGFQSDDTEIMSGISSGSFNSTHWWVNVTIDPGYVLPSLDPGSPNYYVVIRTSGSINTGDRFSVNITTNKINATWGNAPVSGVSSKVIRVDTTNPNIVSPSVDSTSPYIYYDSGVPRVWYGDDMNSVHSFNVTGSASDLGGSGLAVVTFGSNILGAPANDSSPSSWSGTYNDVDKGDSSPPASILVRVYDNAGNTGTWTLFVGRDTTPPSITDGFWVDLSSSPYLWVDPGAGNDDIYYGDGMGGDVTGRLRITPTDSSESGVERVQFSTAVGSSPSDDTTSLYQGNYIFNSGDTTSGTLTITVIDNVSNTYQDSSTWTYTRDITDPSITDGDWSESSIYLYVNTTDDTQDNTLYYSHGMGASSQNGQISFSLSDNVQLFDVSYSGEINYDSSPDFLSGTSDNSNVIYSFSNSDSYSGYLTITVTDACGNSNGYSSTWSVVYDSTTPSIQYSYPTSGGNTSWYYNDPGAVIVINFSWEGAGNSPLNNASYRIGSGAWVDMFDTNQSSDYNTAWSIPWDDLKNGLNMISLRVSDCVGNDLTHTYSLNTYGFGFLKDNSTPTITYNNPSIGGDTTWYSSDPGTVVDIDFGTIGFSPLVSASYQIGSNSWVYIFNSVQSSDYTTDWNIIWAQLVEGENQISVRVSNQAGRTITHTYSSSTFGFKFKKDTTAPGILYNSPSAGGNTSWLTSDPTNIIDIDFQWVANSPLDYAQYKIGTGNWIDIFTLDQATDYTDYWGIIWDQLAEGENEISICVADSAGNIVTHMYILGTNGFIIKKDTAAPTQLSISINNGDEFTNSTSVSLAISATDATSGVYQMRISNDGVFDTEHWEEYSTSRLWTLEDSDGTKTVYIQFRDYALKTSSIMSETIILDETAPTISEPVLTPLNLTEDSSGIVNITVNINDGTAGAGVLSAKIKYSINGISIDQYTDMIHISGNQWYFTIDIEASGNTWDELQELTLTYSIKAADNAGNIRTSAIKTEYIDSINDPPDISGAPTSISLIIGEDKVIDFSKYISDVDNALSELSLATDSSYTTVSGLVITFNYPSEMSSGQVLITVSDGIDSTQFQLKISVAPKIVTITQDYVTAKIYLTSIGQITIDTNLVSFPAQPENKLLVGSPFNITLTGGSWKWIYIEVDYSGVDITKVTESSFILYYWDASTSTWKACEITSPDTTSNIVNANVTTLATFSIFGMEKQSDNDGDDIPDSIDPDDDNDDMPDVYENKYPELDPYTDDSTGDIDGDGLTNLEESNIFTNPTNIDSDADEIDDKWEYDYGLDPLNATDANEDSDGDGYSNLEEYEDGTNPMDDSSKPKASSDTENPFIMYIGIILVIIIIILLLSYMMFRNRAGTRGGVGEFAPKPDDEGGLPGGEDEVRADMGEDYEPDYEFEPDEVEPGVLKPAVTTMPLEGEVEVFELAVAEPCGVCQGTMEIGEKALTCYCGLTTHIACIGEMQECPQCGNTFDLEELGITKEDLVPPVKAAKPMIHREIVREIQVLPPPENAYFVYIPEKTKQQDIHNYVSGYYRSHKIGRATALKDSDKIDIFISIEAAKKMMDHCYTQGRKKEVMGLILGETYKHENKTYSIARDVATSELDATEVNVRFDSFDQLFDQLEGLSYDYQILGWYHSHPDYSSFMSPTDIDTQKRMFKLPYQYAIVIDPIQFDIKAFGLEGVRKKKAPELPFAIFNFDKFQQHQPTVEPKPNLNQVIDRAPISKPMIRNELKQETPELQTPPIKAYLSYIPGVTNDRDVKNFLSEYFKKRKTGKAIPVDDLANNISLFLTLSTAKKMFDHCYKHRNEKEVMGLLIGKTYSYQNKILSITKDAATSELDATVVNVRFDNFEKLFDQLDKLDYDYQILGWYHSHPGHTCFMSPIDVDTQKRMFKHPYQYAIVIDPINNDMKAFTLDQKTKSNVKARGYAIIDFKE